MVKYYYINARGEQVGPMERYVLLKVGITPDTMVWKEGLPDWVPARRLPELRGAYGMSSSGDEPPHYGASRQAREQPGERLPYSEKPPTYMWLAICTTLLCCLPFGIVSIVYAAKVDSCWNAGLYDSAYDNSSKAKNWGIASAMVSVGLAVIYMLLIGIAAIV